MTRIVVTTGPACASDETLRALLKAGADAFRFPASKTSVAALAQQAVRVRALAEDLGRPVQLLLDLPGAKPRLTNDAYLDLSSVTELRLRFDGSAACVDGPVPVLGVAGTDPGDPLPGVGDVLLIGDGEDALRVTGHTADTCTAVPLTGGVIGRRRGIALPRTGRPGRAHTLTPHDLNALRSAPRGVFDAVVLSFTESPGLLALARTVLAETAPGGPRPQLIAKVETAAGAAAADAIAAAADGILLGRGDLLLDTGPVEFHAACRRVLDAGRAAGCPVDVGTQLLTGLDAGWLPHRSELAHLAALLTEGVGGLMLAEETAAAADPVRAVALLDALRDRYAPTPRPGPVVAPGPAPSPASAPVLP
ncbi:pyruvate kinase [Streptomyces sp. NPDC004111]|uniref:pyruvate kinase n=1 Tax=Streptomyces sp. NPDC004111 TaxID=3364690 RepID=UPI0036A225DA